MADEHYGVFDSTKTYTQHAVARILGVSDSAGRCSQFVLNRLLKDGVPFRKVGKFYFINGQSFNLWVQEGSASWEAWTDNTKSSNEESETDSSSDIATPAATGGKRRSRRRDGETLSS